MRPLDTTSLVSGALKVASFLELAPGDFKPHKDDAHEKKGHDAHGHDKGSGGDAHAHQQHGHGDGDSNLRVALSLTTVGAVIAVMSILYLVNARDLLIRRASWNIISATVCIFAAVLLFTAVNEFTIGIFIGENPNHHAEGGHHEAPSVKALMLDFVKATFLFLLLQGLLVRLRTHEKTLEATAKIGAHVVGFALIEFFGTMQLMHPFDSSPVYSLVIVLIAAGLVVSMSVGCSYYRSHYFAEEEERHEEFKEICADAEDDYIGLLMGMLLCQVTKFCIVGAIAPIHGAPAGKTPVQVVLLFAAAMVFAGGLVLVAAWQQKLAFEDAPARIRRAANIIQMVVSMALGWHLLYAGMWLFWTLTSGAGVAKGDVLVAGLLRFATFAVVGVLAIFGLDLACEYGLLPRRAVNALVDSVGLLLGLSWEGTIDTAVEGMHTVMPHGIMFIDAFVDLVLAVFVVPAWALYIRPRANEAEEEVMASMSSGKQEAMEGKSRASHAI